MSNQRSPGLGPPPRGLFGGGCLLSLVVVVAGAILVGCSEVLPAAEPAAPPRGFALLSYEQIPWTTQGAGHLAILCDTKRGNLIYLTPGYRENGIAVVPGGCKQ